MVSQTTANLTVCSTSCSGQWQKQQSTALLALCERNPLWTAAFRSQRDSNMECFSRPGCKFVDNVSFSNFSHKIYCKMGLMVFLSAEIRYYKKQWGGGALNTLRPRQNGRHFPDDIFKWIFLNQNVWISINILLKFLPRGLQLTIFQHWFRKWLGADQATSHYLNQWWLDYRRIYASVGLNELKHPLALLPCFLVLL